MTDLSKVYDLKDEGQAKEYLDNLGVEYHYQCYKENLPGGCHRLADFLEAFRRDVVKARGVYETNCKDNKYGHSCFKAGNYSLIGRGGEKSEEKAFEFFTKGCEYNYNSNCHNAGLLLGSGALNGEKDFAEAAKYFKLGCDRDYGASCQELSTYNIAGKKGVKKDMSEAFKYASKACDLGHMYACANLSVMYKRGDGIAKSLEMAEKCKARAKFLQSEMHESKGQIEFGQ